MSHSHSHNRPQRISSLNGIYIAAIALNLTFVVVEAAVGLLHNSLGLVSDAGHKLLDCFWLLIAMLAFKLTATKPTKRYTYGFGKASVLISLLNAVVLTVVIIAIIIGSVGKFRAPSDVNGAVMSWTAAAGIMVSGISALLLMRHQRGDVNTRGAFLHMAADALMSIGVVVSGLAIKFTGWNIIDPIVSLLIACVILVNTCKLLAECFRMSVDAVPRGVDYDRIKEAMLAVEGVRSVDSLHIWPLNVFDAALTAHVGIDGNADGKAVLEEIRAVLEREGLKEITVELHSA